jgi:hypothetical protein
MQLGDLAYFIPFTGLTSGCSNTAQHSERNGQETHHALATFSAQLQMAYCPVIVVPIQLETANRKHLTVDTAAHRNLGGV